MLMQRYLAAIALCSLVSCPAVAQDSISYNASPEKEIQLGIYATVAEPCLGNPIPQLRIAKAPTGGKLIVRVLAAPIPAGDAVCAGKKIPAQVVYYQSDPGFAGEDQVILDIGVKGQPIRTQEISIVVTAP
jgi:hypothetical protein